MPTGILSDMTLDEVRAFGAEVVALTVASTEPHGPHLPYGTDFFQADALCRRAVTRANAKGGRVLMYPTLPIGNNVNFKAWPFACRIGVRTLMRVLLDIIKALEEDGIRKVFLLDGHGGNSAAVRAAMREHVDLHGPESPDCAFVCVAGVGAFMPKDVAAQITDGSNHGGDYETSMISYLHPDKVRTDKLAEHPFGIPEIEELRTRQVEFVTPWHLHVPDAAGGRPQDATAEKGEAIIERGADALADFLLRLSNTPWHPKFPYAPE